MAHRKKTTSQALLGLLAALTILNGCVSTSKNSQLIQRLPAPECSQVKLDEGTYRISFIGESLTTSTLSADFARFRGADIALKSGYKYFFINKFFVTPGNVPNSLPTNTLIIRCLQSRPADTPLAVYDAEEVSKKIRSQYKIK